MAIATMELNKRVIADAFRAINEGRPEELARPTPASGRRAR